MNSTQSALDMLTKTVTSVAEQLSTIVEELGTFSKVTHLAQMEHVWMASKDIHNALLSALSKVPPATTIEPQTSGEIKSKPISSDTQVATEVSALRNAQVIETLALRIDRLESQICPSGNDG